MKLYEAKNIITEVFENPFDKDKFSYFIRNLLKNIQSAEFLRAGYNIPKAFVDFIASYERIGKYEDEEGNLIDALIIKLKRDHSIDYARSTQRNFVRWYLNDKGKDAALVAFTTEKSSEWRFSFIKMQYSLEKKKDELTPAKRSSFMVGESGKSHTAQRQLIDLLKNDHAPYLSDIENAFSIEAVSDEFYEKYKALLFNMVDEIEKIVKKDKTVKDEFESKNISILNFSKKLLGQIVFLYFLQKKGWLGLEEKAKYGEGDRNFLRSLFNKTKSGENFFNDYLEFLFYDALSKKRVTDYYERFKTRIPFLNGGLFDPIAFYDWQKTDIVIPNKIFSDRKGDEEGTGILDVFDLYNFTVKEDEPLETEVAIDPEMLGKVFERMLDVTERKSKGAFYTPREIVHYMAQQCLLYFLENELHNEIMPKEDLEMFIHYGEHIIDKDIAIEEGKLSQTANKQQIPESIRQNADDIDKALENIKICDPAVGSGAFPVGIMNEIVKLRKLLTPFLKKENVKDRSAYRFKSNAIKNSIYGVDIDAGAVEIAKLRLWLSMVVDEERIDNIEPLPNLEYKIVQGNSLINMPDGCLRNGDLEIEIEKLTKNYYTITDKEEKQRQKEIIDSKIQQLLASASEFACYKIDFDFKLYFHEVWNEKGGFDLVIGNPPYVDSEEMVKNSPEYRKILSSIFITTKGNWDLYIPFFEQSFYCLNEKGILSFITPNKWLAIGYGKELRRFLKHNIFKIGNCNAIKVFDAGNSPFISFIAKNNQNTSFNIDSFDSEYFIKGMYTSSSIVKNYEEWGLLLGNNIDLVTNILSKPFSLSDIIKVENPFTTSEAYTLLDILENNFDFDKELQFKFINTGTITKYGSLWGKKKTTYLKNHYEHPIVDKKLFNKNFPKRFNQAITPKIIIKGIRYFDSFLDIEGLYIAGKSTLVLINPQKHFTLNCVLAIINSRLIFFYLKEAYGALGIDGGINFSKDMVEGIPIAEFSNQIRKFNTIIDYMLFLKSVSGEKMSFYLEQLIDGMVYELYFENEIKHAGCDILKYLNDLPEITAEMDDEEKMKIITKVFNKLYDKESPVRKNLFFMDIVEEVAIIKKSFEK